jgi:DNA-binding transcriptional LysR family regulator
VKLRPLVEVDGVRLLASLVFDGHGPALLPSTAVPEFLRKDVRLVTVDGMAKRHVGLATRSRGLPPAPVRAVVSAVRARASDASRLPEGLRPAPEIALAVAEGAPRSLDIPNG